MNIKYYKPTGQILGKTVTTGLPSLARQGLSSLATILLNTAAIKYGDAAVAAMAICGKIVWFVGSLMIGIGQGFSPVSGYNYGAKRYDRVKQAYFFMLKTGVIIMTSFGIVIFIFANQIMQGFIKDEAAVAVGVVALRWQISFIPFLPLIVGTNMLMQSTRHIKAATFLSMNRNGVYFIPAVLILPRVFGLFGVEITQLVADIFSAITAIPYLIHMFRKLDKKQPVAVERVE
jgi:Na+-driven multidrug efflux pump